MSLHALSGHVSSTLPASSRDTELTQAASKRWTALNGSEKIPGFIQGIRFVDGVRDDREAV
jgi:hypothetical protein